MPYTIDGDLYRREGPLDVVLGPVIRFVRPPSAAKTVVGRLVGSKD
jgi:hypothetical protein